MEFKIITGTAIHCEKELNKIVENYFFSVYGFTATNELTTILILLTSKKTRL